jgi:hypothetical protein
MSTQHYAIGDRVLYVPDIANGDTTHKSVEKGYITDITAQFIFVKFDHQRNLDHGSACNPRNIVKEQQA